MNVPIELMKVLLSLSLSGSLLILLLLLCGPLLRNRLSRRCQYYLWLVVVARLLLPFALETNLVGTLLPWNGLPTASSAPPGNAPPVSASAPLPEMDPPLLEDVPGVNPVQPAVSSAPSAPEWNRWPSPEALAFAVWALGALGLFTWKVTAYQSFLRRVRKGWKEVSDPALLDLLARLGAEAGVDAPVGLYVHPALFSPVLLGVLKPRIVLPATDLPEAELRCTLLHELTHYRRSDMLYKWLVQAVLCVHWFNPLVHWMAGEINRACELACDEAVIRSLDVQGRRDYGDTLLHAMEAGGGYRGSALPLYHSKSQLKERLGAIMKVHTPTPLTAISSLAAVLLLVICAAAAGAYVAPDSPAPGRAEAQIVEESGVYYLFVNGADESDRPSGGMADGVVKFVLVRPDSYATLSGFDSTDGLADQVAEQCRLMTAQGTISQEEAELVIGLAHQLQTDSSAVPDSVKGDPLYEHFYTQNTYYQGDFIFELGWNVRESAKESYAHTELILPEGGQITVLYNDICQTWMQNQEARDALTALLSRLRTEQSDFPPVRPLVVSVVPANGKTPGELARQYAEEGNMPRFTAAFSKLDENGQRSWLDRFYNHGQVAYFAASLARLPEGSPLIAEYLENACNDGQTALFSICLEELTDRDENSPLLDRYAEQTYASGEIALFTILSEYMSQEALERWLDRAEADGRNNFRAVLSDKTGKDEWLDAWKAAEYAERVEEYRAHGIILTNDTYFYQGQRVRVFLDSRPDSSLVTLDYDAQGTVDVRVVRDEDENIASVGLMTAAEAEEIIRELTEDDWDDDWEDDVWDWLDSDPIDGDEHVVYAQYDRIPAGEYVWLGTFYMEEGDQVRYHVTAESGQRMEAGFARPGEGNPDVRYYSVTSGLEINTGALTWRSPAESGEYRLFLHAVDGNLTGVDGYIVVTKAKI